MSSLIDAAHLAHTMLRWAPTRAKASNEAPKFDCAGQSPSLAFFSAADNGDDILGRYRTGLESSDSCWSKLFCSEGGLIDSGGVDRCSLPSGFCEIIGGDRVRLLECWELGENVVFWVCVTVKDGMSGCCCWCWCAGLEFMSYKIESTRRVSIGVIIELSRESLRDRNCKWGKSKTGLSSCCFWRGL